MDIIKVVSFGIIVCALYILLENFRPEYSFLILTGASVILLFWGIEQLNAVLSYIKNLVESVGISGDVAISILKIIGIGFVAELGAGLCEDCGAKSLGEKARWIGKILIFTEILPFIQIIMDVVGKLFS